MGHFNHKKEPICFLLLALVTLFCDVCLFFSPPFWFRQKYLNNYLMDCCEILYIHSWSPDDESN